MKNLKSVYQDNKIDVKLKLTLREKLAILFRKTVEVQVRISHTEEQIVISYELVKEV